VDLQQQLSPPVLTKSPTRSYARSRGSNRLPPPFFRGSRPPRPVATDSSDATAVTSATAASHETPATAAAAASDALETAAELAAEFEAPALAGTQAGTEAEAVFDGWDELSDAPNEPNGFEPPPGFERDIAVIWAPASEWYHDASTVDVAAGEPDMTAGGDDGAGAAAEVDTGAWEPYRIADPEPSAFSVDQPDASHWALEFGAPASEAEHDPEYEQHSQAEQHSEAGQASEYEHGADADGAVGAPGIAAFSEIVEVDRERPAPDEGHDLARRVAAHLEELADELRENGMAALTRQSDADELARVIAAVIAGFRSREHE
jgi:hypothetical protein